jgi:hypothetical protein
MILFGKIQSIYYINETCAVDAVAAAVAALSRDMS